jgi:hypothetical protein
VTASRTAKALSQLDPSTDVRRPRPRWIIVCWHQRGELSTHPGVEAVSWASSAGGRRRDWTVLRCPSAAVARDVLASYDEDGIEPEVFSTFREADEAIDERSLAAFLGLMP